MDCRNPSENKIFCTHPHQLWSSPILLYNAYQVYFLGVQQLACGIDHPPPSSVMVRERVELYLYSPSGPS
jgi:hypothetical protein